MEIYATLIVRHPPSVMLFSFPNDTAHYSILMTLARLCYERIIGPFASLASAGRYAPACFINDLLDAFSQRLLLGNLVIFLVRVGSAFYQRLR